MAAWKTKALILALALGGQALAGQGLGVDRVELGAVAQHDHVAFDYHIPIKDDPYPHQVKEGYAFDGVDVGGTVFWHWGEAALQTRLWATPVARPHFAYDQDTDFEPTTAATHGDEGEARSRSFGVTQAFPLFRWGKFPVAAEMSFLRQYTRYRQVTTYDLNTNPALPSTYYQRLIYERAILYEIRSGLSAGRQWRAGAWQVGGALALAPLSSILLHNYVPELAATSAPAFGGSLELDAQRGLGAWGLALQAGAGQYHGYSRAEGFERQQFWLQISLAPPRFW